MIFSALDFFPAVITLLITCCTSRLRYMESGSRGRIVAWLRRGI